MAYDYDFMYGMEDSVAVGFAIFYIVYYLLTLVLSIVSYILNSLGMQTIAKRRGINNPWMAWIPVANMWILGSISDQYRYVTKGQIKNKRKALIGLWIGLFAMMIAMFVSMIVGMLAMEEAAATGAAMMIVMLVSMLAMLVVSLVFMVFYYMALYDLYTAANPNNGVTFLVLSILFRVTEPFFVFAVRKKDFGMPPRRDVPAAQVPPAPQYLPPQQPVQEPWENVTEE